MLIDPTTFNLLNYTSSSRYGYLVAEPLQKNKAAYPEGDTGVRKLADRYRDCQLYFYSHHRDAQERLDAERFRIDESLPVEERQGSDGRIWQKIPMEHGLLEEMDKSGLKDEFLPPIISGETVFSEPRFWTTLHHLPGNGFLQRFLVSTDEGKHYLILHKTNNGDLTPIPVQPLQKNGMIPEQDPSRLVQGFDKGGNGYLIMEVPRLLAGALRRSPKQNLLEITKPLADVAQVQEYARTSIDAAVLAVHQKPRPPEREVKIAEPVATPLSAEEKLHKAAQKLKSEMTGLEPIRFYRQRMANGTYQIGIRIPHEKLGAELLEAIRVVRKDGGQAFEFSPQSGQGDFRLVGITEDSLSAFIGTLTEFGLNVEPEIATLPWRVPQRFVQNAHRLLLGRTDEGEHVLYVCMRGERLSGPKVRSKLVTDITTALGLPVSMDGKRTVEALPAAQGHVSRILLPAECWADTLQLLHTKQTPYHMLEALPTLAELDRAVVEQIAHARTPARQAAPRPVAEPVSKAFTPAPPVLAKKQDNLPLSPETLAYFAEFNGEQMILAHSVHVTHSTHTETNKDTGRKKKTRHQETIRDQWVAVRGRPAFVDAIAPSLKSDSIIEHPKGQGFTLIKVTKELYDAIGEQHRTKEGVSTLDALKGGNNAIAFDILPDRIRKRFEDITAEQEEKLTPAETFVRHLRSKDLLLVNIQYPDASQLGEIMSHLTPNMQEHDGTIRVVDGIHRVVTSHAAAVAVFGPEMSDIGRAVESHSDQIARAKGILDDQVAHVKGVLGNLAPLREDGKRRVAELQRWMAQHTDKDNRQAPALFIVNPSQTTMQFAESKDEELRTWRTRAPLTIKNGAGKGRDVLVLYPSQEGLERMQPAIDAEECIKDRTVTLSDTERFIREHFHAVDERNGRGARRAAAGVPKPSRDAEKKQAEAALGRVHNRIASANPLIARERVINSNSVEGGVDEVIQNVMIFKVASPSDAEAVVNIAKELNGYLQGRAERDGKRINGQLGDYIELRLKQEERNEQKLMFEEMLFYLGNLVELLNHPQADKAMVERRIQSVLDRAFGEQNRRYIAEYNAKVKAQNATARDEDRQSPLSDYHDAFSGFAEVLLNAPEEGKRKEAITGIKRICQAISATKTALETDPHQATIVQIERSHPTFVKGYHNIAVRDERDKEGKLRQWGELPNVCYGRHRLYDATTNQAFSEDGLLQFNNTSEPCLVKIHLDERIMDACRRKWPTKRVLPSQVKTMNPADLSDHARDKFGMDAAPSRSAA